MAQVVAHLVWDQGVAGSSPVFPTNFYYNMTYVILKKTDYNCQKKVVLVNDSEGEPIEYSSFEAAQRIADLFQNNTTHDSVYEVRAIGSGTSN